jgi:hypothetical protein
MVPHVKNKLTEATEAFELWLDEHSTNDELVDSELLEKAQGSLKAAQDFIEQIEAVDVEEGMVEENATENNDDTTAEANGEEVMEPAESSDEESD